jgi:2-polyprenyl-3-methyl-5-hydroxy-6-metoxy-1,4-benzoquinol methylase
MDSELRTTDAEGTLKRPEDAGGEGDGGLQELAAADAVPAPSAQFSPPAKERLTFEEVEAGDLLALTHLHRYELAGALLGGKRVVDVCCGVGYGSRMIAEAGAVSVCGVDVDEQAIGEASAAAGGDERLRFVREDAARFLEQLGAGEVDAIVCFEGVEHVPDPVALADALARLVRDGVSVLLSLPNSKGYHEHNEHHTTDFGFEQASELLARIGEHELLTQHLAEGSLMLAPGEIDAGELSAESRVLVAGASAPWANHWIAAFNVGEGELASAAASFRLASVPNNGAYMNALERSNAELHHANQRMARAWLGIHDAAAAAVIHRLEEKQRALDDEMERLRKRAREADEYQARLRRADHRFVDRIAMSLKGVPGLKRLAGRRPSDG